MTLLRSDAALRRDQILDAADAVFAERGITAPLDLVVTRAGVGRATLYRNFPDRAALVEALFERTLAGLERAAKGQDLFALVEQVGLDLVGAPALADYWRALEPGHPAAKSARERLARLFRAPLAAALARNTCRADLRPADLVLVCGMLGAALRGATPAQRRTLVRRALDLLHGGLATRERGR
ncbi:MULTISPECIES: TetR/AcrR family transcriptional regulator [unclassified Massilia]|uniref:TetR/AcrR family transcriptional regulator n=1 Tax=unclassified Massilia TaxID=2609279 RepID=UPI00178382E7|nr:MULTISPECIES: helix-turn-helix domain-containing protein [unclassified Massilia]MBD8528587.1 helix-turn-helix transcriptional regulator [Massilia sp. CFBP 13647]MBD8671790.1 helix-turn-helix transcriptional regulator [Massilia sp. CFBP 13721]